MDPLTSDLFKANAMVTRGMAQVWITTYLFYTAFLNKFSFGDIMKKYFTRWSRSLKRMNLLA